MLWKPHKAYILTSFLFEERVTSCKGQKVYRTTKLLHSETLKEEDYGLKCSHRRFTS
jgi:hypothetical protein